MIRKIIQVIPAVADLYAVWEEGSDNGKRYGVDRTYYLGLSDEGEIYPLPIDGDGYIDVCSCDDYMVFDWNGYQMWKRHEAELPVYEYYNRFEMEQRMDNKKWMEELYQ